MPKIGSRLTEYIIFKPDNEILYPWRLISEGEYRFITFTNKEYSGVRFVINEILFC